MAAKGLGATLLEFHKRKNPPAAMPAMGGVGAADGTGDGKDGAGKDGEISPAEMAAGHSLIAAFRAGDAAGLVRGLKHLDEICSEPPEAPEETPAEEPAGEEE